MRIVLISLLLVAGFDAERLSAQGFDKEVAFLQIPTGARVVGLGRAAVALPGEFQALRWNPAALGSLDRFSPLVSHYDGPLDFAVSQLAVAMPVRAVGVLAVSLEVQSFGEIPLTAPGSPDAAAGAISPSNVVLSLAFAHSFARLSVGVTGKWVHSELVGELSGSTLAFDMGLLWKPLSRVPLNLGASALNLGSGLQTSAGLDGSSDPLPSRIRVGVGYDVLTHLRPGKGLQLLLQADLEHALRHLETGSQFVGAELGVREVLFIRGGYIAETLIETNSGTTLGVGLAVGPISFDLARELGVNQLGDETHLSLSARI